MQTHVALTGPTRQQVLQLMMTKLVPVPVELSKLSGVAKYNVVKNAVYDKLVEKANNIDTNGFVLKTKYDADKLELEKKFLNY